MSKNNVYKVRQGDIYYVDFPESIGSVQKGIRPVVITQNNFLNRHSTTFVCALVTSQIKRLDLKEHVLLPKLKGLPKQSMVMVEQRATVDRKQLEDYRGHIDWLTFQKINRALRKCESANKRDYEMKW